MKKELYQHQNKLAAMSQMIDSTAPALQALVDEAKTINAMPRNMDEIHSLLKDPVRYARSRWIEQMPKEEPKQVGIFFSAPKDLLAGLQLPNTANLQNTVAGIGQQLNRNSREGLPEFKHYLSIDGGKVVKNDDAIQAYTDANTRYVKSDAELADWEMHSKVADEVNKLLEHYEANGQQPHLTPEWLHSKLNLKTIDGKTRFAINVDAFERRVAGLPEGGIPLPNTNQTPTGMKVREIHASALGEANNTIKAGQANRVIAEAAKV